MEMTTIEVIRLLRRAGHKPRVHGNGFIQFDLSPQQRFHFWGHHKIPRQCVPTPIHDHLFAFTSKVLLGEIGNIVYGCQKDDANGQFAVLEAYPREGADTELAANGERVNIAIITMQCYKQGETYFSHAGQFHETIARRPAVTLIAKEQPAAWLLKPRVLIERGREPDNKFDRNSFSEKLLWDIITDIFAEHGETL